MAIWRRSSSASPCAASRADSSSWTSSTVRLLADAPVSAPTALLARITNRPASLALSEAAFHGFTAPTRRDWPVSTLSR